MRQIAYQRAGDPSTAIQALAAGGISDNGPAGAPIQALAGGTTLIDLMKLDVMRPSTLVDINPLASSWSGIGLDGDGLKLGALARMSDVAAHPDVQRFYPVVADSLKLAASPQLRNMATLGGMSRSERAAPIFATSATPNAISAIPAPAVLPWTVSTEPTPCLARRTRASRHIPATSRRR